MRVDAEIALRHKSAYSALRASPRRLNRRRLGGVWLSTAFHNDGDVIGWRGARPARREEGAYREYATDEQRSQAGGIASRMSPSL